MAINVADNFSYKGGKPLDARTKYATVADMVATPAADLYDGCLAYVTATKKNYQYDSTNETDPTLGKWRELQTGGGGTDYTAGDGIDITEDVISVDPMPAEDMDDVISPLPSVQSRYHKYSTEEHIVGEWIDGSTLYEKTFSTNITVTNTWCGNVDVSNCNIDEIKSSFASGSYNNQKVSMYPVIRVENGVLDLLINGMVGVVLNQITIQYTKSE